MPEGLTSIEDLKVVISAETEQMTAGLANAKEIIATFASTTGVSLGLVDASFTKIGSAIDALKGRLGLWLSIAETVATAAGKLAVEGEKVGRALGEAESIDKLKAAWADLAAAVGEGAAGAFGSATQALAQFGAGIIHSGEAGSSGVLRLKSGFGELADVAEKAMRYAEQGVRNLAPDDGEATAAKVVKQIEHLRQHIGEMERIRSEVGANKNGGMFDWLADAQIERYGSIIADLTIKLGALVDQRDELIASSKAGWATLTVENEQAERAIANLERQARGLRQEAEARRMSAEAAAEYKSKMSALNAMADGNATPTRGDLARINSAAAEVARLSMDKRAAEKAERDQDRSDKEDERQQKRLAQTIAGGFRSRSMPSLAARAAWSGSAS